MKSQPCVCAAKLPLSKKEKFGSGRKKKNASRKQAEKTSGHELSQLTWNREEDHSLDVKILYMDSLS